MGADDVQGSSLPNSSESTQKERQGEPPQDANLGTIQAALGRIIKKFNVQVPVQFFGKGHIEAKVEIC